MKTLITWLPAATCCLALVAPGHGGEGASDEAKPVPQTRPEMKKAIEGLKRRQPRLPLPPFTAEVRRELGDRPPVINLRMRMHYLPKEWVATSTWNDPSFTFDRTTRVKLFWIVSRGNNCYYCLGHQEHGLKQQGLPDDTVAALDCDWSIFPPREQAAMALALKLTHEPHRVTAADIDELRPHFSNREIIELAYQLASFNATNRWTDSLGLPQDEGFGDTPVELDTPTSEKFSNVPSKVAPRADASRPPLESPAEVEAAISACRARTARVELPSEAEARAVLPADWPAGPLPQWVRALSVFPQAGVARASGQRLLESSGDLAPLLKAQIAWTAARHDRAWYALAHARQRLAALGMAEDDMFALEGSAASLPAGDREALKFAAKLTTAPHRIADADIARLREHFSDTQVAQIVFVVCAANFFDRFTEALGLALES